MLSTQAGLKGLLIDFHMKWKLNLGCLEPGTIKTSTFLKHNLVSNTWLAEMYSGKTWANLSLTAFGFSKYIEFFL